MEPFIKNHQYNFVKKQAEIVQNALKTSADPKVIEAVRYSAEYKIMEQFPGATMIQKQLLTRLSIMKTPDEFHQYLLSLRPMMVEFQQVTQKEIKKLFPKNKRLGIPDLSLSDYRNVTYLGWSELSTNKLFIVYHLNGKAVGVEGKYSITNKKNVCFMCNGYGEVALFSAITKTRNTISPDYYKAIGNYLCVNSHECNKNITDVAALEGFIQEVLGT